MRDFHKSFSTDSSPEKAFGAIKLVAQWWTPNLEGNSENAGDEFSVRFGDVHYSRHKLTEVIANKKIVWLTTDSHLNFTKNSKEWTGTQVVFDISEANGKTKVDFTHAGLNPEIECFDACSNAWPEYVDKLKTLIENQ